ncbi:MAG: LptA/OstA family protein, partial [Armatimonadota bacterium]
MKHQSCGYFNNSKVKTIWVAAAFFLLAFAITVQPPAAASDAVNLSADSTRWYTDDRVVARSNVKVVYKEFTVTSDSLEADLATNIAVFTDNVKLLTGGQTASGAQLTLNLKTREWNFTDAKSVMAPDKLGGRVQGSAYIKSREISGTSKETRLDSGTLTTCDLENPHYCFSAEKMDIYPGSRIIAYKVSIYGKDKRLVTFERLAIPIRGLSTNLIPQVGSSAEEGMYLKAAYPYMAE